MPGETEADVSGWTVDTLHVFMQRQLDDMRIGLDERYATQSKALDAAFVAQQVAMRTAFEAADKAVQAALEAAEKAVGKAEVAAEKRFDSVNEFRQQLGDQAATFMPRTESEANAARTAERLQDLTDRVNKTEGRSSGLNAGWGFLIGGIGLIATIVAIFAVIVPLMIR